MASDNHEVFEEGLFIPLVRLYDAGRLNQGVLDMIRANVRTPDQVNGDIRSQIAANHVCAEQIVRMLEEYGLDGPRRPGRRDHRAQREKHARLDRADARPACIAPKA